MTTPTEARALIAKLQDVWPGDDPIVKCISSLADQVDVLRDLVDFLTDKIIFSTRAEK